MSDVEDPRLEAAREQTVGALRQHFATGVIDVDGFERRVDHAQRATTVQALAIITSDLPALTVQTSTSLMPLESRQLSSAVPERENIIAVFGGVERKGSWTVARHTRAITIMGGGSLDLRNARFDDGVYELQVVCMMGGLEIIVPPWLRVENHASAFFGGVDHETSASESSSGPILRIKGVILFGGIEVSERLPGESAREAKKRRKAEARALKAGRKAISG